MLQINKEWNTGMKYEINTFLVFCNEILEYFLGNKTAIIILDKFINLEIFTEFVMWRGNVMSPPSVNINFSTSGIQLTEDIEDFPFWI